MRKSMTIALTTFIAISASAQEKKQAWINNVKLSGYSIVQYQASNQEGAKANSFNLRIARVSLDGRVMKDFFWKAQIQFNGNTSTLVTSPKVVDLFAEWQKYDFFRVKVGQFKNPFTFENPMNPIDQGFMSYGQAVLKLAGFSDRAGTHSSNGRDIGVQLQGDLFKTPGGRSLIHYQVGLFNGQGINMKDVDQQKNLIGGAWVMPLPGMRIGVFGWTGSHARKGTWTDAGGGAGVRSLQQRRYAFSAEYKTCDWTFRSEYAHSTGSAFDKSLANTNDKNSTNCDLSTDGDKAQGVYALVIAPIVKNKVHLKGRYDMYQPTGDARKQKTLYEIGADYLFHKNFQVSAECALVNDRALARRNYGILDIEVAYRF